MNGSGDLRVLSSISYDAALLPHFVDYYRGLGVENFAISVHEQRPGILAVVEALAATLGPGITLHPASAWQERTGVEGANKNDLRRRVAQLEDWLIPADLDEFIQFPLPLPALIGKLIEADAQCVMGRFRDRLAWDGVLVPTAPTPSVWEQYPLEADISSQLVKGLCTKVVLCRDDCEIGSGHHFVRGTARVLSGTSGIVHHFKWRAGLADALTQRVAIYRREKVPWVDESERVLAYLAEHGRIVPEHFAPRTGWQPDVAAADDTISTV